MEALEFYDRLRKATSSNVRAFRHLVNGDSFLDTWMVREYCQFQQDFVDDFNAGKRPIYIVSMPPQHGKTVGVGDLISYMAINNNLLKMVYSTYDKGLGRNMNKQIQGILTSPIVTNLFGSRLVDRNIRTLLNFQRNSEVLDFINDRNKIIGFFKNVTIGGALTGFGADVLFIDDVFKDWASAQSAKNRQAIWDWYLAVAKTRLAMNNGQFIIMTRWHKDDLIGRILATPDLAKRVRVLNFPAIATEDEKHRLKGEALFPEHKDLEFLKEIKGSMTKSMWLALYQGQPADKDGNLIKIKTFQRYKKLPPLSYKLISIDTATKTKEINDFTVLQAWGRRQNENGRYEYYLIDQLRVKKEYTELKRLALQFIHKHNPNKTVVEDMNIGTALINELRENGIYVVGVKPFKDKVERYREIEDLQELGYVFLPEDAPFIEEFEEEAMQFPYAKNDDQVDTYTQALKELRVGTSLIKQNMAMAQ